jgi:hypothetical protein
MHIFLIHIPILSLARVSNPRARLRCSIKHTLLPTRILKPMHVKYTIPLSVYTIAFLKMNPRGSKHVEVIKIKILIYKYAFRWFILYNEE